MSGFFEKVMQSPSEYFTIKFDLESNRKMLKKYGNYTDEQLAALDAKQSQEHLDRVVSELTPEMRKRYAREIDMHLRLVCLQFRKSVRDGTAVLIPADIVDNALKANKKANKTKPNKN